MSDSNHDVVVIGAGVTGLAAARQALQSGLSTLVLECLMYGGLVLNVNELDGEIKGSGADFASGIMMDVLEHGGEQASATATSIAPSDGGFLVASDTGTHRTRAVIVASGARLRRLGVPGESEFEGKGVSHCADCDGPLYRGQEVTVVGGGDSALQEALVLAKFCRRVNLVHRGDRFSAQPYLIDAVAKHENIVIHSRSAVQQVLGNASVEAVRVQDTEGGASSEISCAGVFVYVGLEPACEFVPANVARDAHGFLLTDSELRTNVSGIFAAGAVRSGYAGMLTHAMAEGVAAARGAKRIVTA